MVEDENLVYNSPSEIAKQLKNSNSYTESLKQEDYEGMESLELPILNIKDILSPEEGSITRYANIFDKLEGSDSEDQDFNNFFRDSYSDSAVYNSDSRLKNLNFSKNNYKESNYNHNEDQNSERSLTFSDRVVKERQRMIRKKLLSNMYTNESFRTNASKSTRRLKPHSVEKAFSFIELEDTSKVELDAEKTEKHNRIDNILNSQKEQIRDLNSNISRSVNSNKNEAFLYIQQENSRLLQENEQNCERIRTLKMEMENVQSDLIVERKQNEQLLKDKVELQNRLNLLSKENKSLLTSQEMMQNMHKNEVEELNNKKTELSAKISKLESDIDYFRENLQESHKMNEILKSEISSMIEVSKKERGELQKLKTENKRLMENNSIYKSQNYSLIEINDRLRNRTLFREHRGDSTTSNSSTITNSTNSENLKSQSNLGLCTPLPPRSSALGAKLVHNSPDRDLNYLKNDSSNSSKEDASIEDSLNGWRDGYNNNRLNLTPNSQNSFVSSPKTFFLNCKDKHSDQNSLLPNFSNSDFVLNTLTSENSPDRLLNMNSGSNSMLNNNLDSNLDQEENYNIVRITREERLQSPATKWVADRVSRNSSVDALKSLREKIKSITTDSDVENVNINTGFKCFQNNVTINLIQNKLQLISQRLNETIV